MLYSLSNAQAQLWKKVLPFMLNYGPYVMYEDTTDHTAYIAGAFSSVGGTPCNMIKWDGSNFTLLPPFPLVQYLLHNKI